MLLTTRPVRSANAVRNGGHSGAASGSLGTAASTACTQAGSSSVNTTACAANDKTPASRGDGCGTTVTVPSDGGNTPPAASARISRTPRSPTPKPLPCPDCLPRAPAYVITPRS